MSAAGFSRSTLCRWGVSLVALMLVFAGTAPLWAPYPPQEQLDPVAGRHLPPLTSRSVVRLHDDRWILAEQVRKTEKGLEVRRLDGVEIVPYDRIENLSVDGVRDRRFFFLGTDKFGRDLWSRLALGARISLAIGVSATLISLILGTVVGSLAALVGGWFDSVLMRLVDAILMFPRLFLILALAALFEAQLWVVILVLGFTGWMSVSRLARAELLRLRRQEFVLAAHSIGQHPLRVFLRHMLPNALAPLLVHTALRVGNVILIEAALSFLGFGVQPPTPSWGNIVADGADALPSAWWVSTFPGLAICLTVIAFNLLGDGLRDTLDPRASGR